MDLDEYAIHLQQDVKASRELLSYMVDQAVTEWTIFNIRSEEESYITDQKRDECLEWVIRRIVKQSTPAIMEQIRIGYPADNLEQYTESIKDVAVLHITNMVIRQNTKMMDDNNPNSYINIANRM